MLFSPGLRDVLALLGVYAAYKHVKFRRSQRVRRSSPGTEQEYTDAEYEAWQHEWWPEE